MSRPRRRPRRPRFCLPGSRLMTSSPVSSRSGRMKSRTARAPVPVLNTTLRDFWEVLRRRVHRKKEPVAVLAFYQLPTSGDTPDMTTYDQLRELARQVVKGDADAVTAGHPAMANPDATELQAALTAAYALATAVPTADRDYDLAQTAVAALRPQMDELIDDGIKDIRNSTRKLDAPSQRRILRTYGAQFATFSGEPADPPAPAGG